MLYKRLTDYKRVDVKDYVSEYIKNNPDTIVYVGCDSQHLKDLIKYATCIVLYKMGRGGHVLFNVDKIQPTKGLTKEQQVKMRIMGEVQRSIDIASYLKYECDIAVERIDLDINEDKYYRSNVALTEAVGYCEGMGFKSRHKPDELWAVRVANTLCR